MTTVMITGIGGDIAQGVATIIRESRPGIRLVGADVHDQHAGRLFVDAVHMIPLARDPGYRDRLKAIIVQESVDIVFPMTEPELTVLNGRFGDYPACRWVFAGEQVLRQCLDKLATARMLESLGLPAPWTILAAVSGPREYPCILKSRSGSGSRSVHIVKDAEEAAYLSKRDSGAIFQELLLPADREVTCAVYRTRDGRVTTLQMLRRLVGGFTGWARVIDDQPTTAMCEAVAHHLDLRGSMNVQLRITGEGPRIFEINPRFSSTSLMRHRLGFSDVLWALTEAEGGEVSFPAIAAGSVLVRLQAAAVMDDNQKAAQP